MWKSEQLIKQENEIDALLAKLKPLDQFEKEINAANKVFDQANTNIKNYINTQQRLTYGL